MKTLKATAERLAEKQSWVIKGLCDWLNTWEKATSEDLNSNSLLNLVIHREDQPAGYDCEWYYFLTRGEATIERMYSEDYLNTSAQNRYGNATRAVYHIGTNEEIEVIREIIKGLPAALEKYIERLEKEEKSYGELQAMLDRLNQPL